jgi:copper homeostasis protein
MNNSIDNIFELFLPLVGFVTSIILYRSKYCKYLLNSKEDNIIEISLCDIRSVIEACNGEANSIELCCNLNDGGVTPSIGLIKQCLKLTSSHNVEVHVLIRPRAGDFIYNDDEFEVMISDIIQIRKLGVHGILHKIF